MTSTVPERNPRPAERSVSGNGGSGSGRLDLIRAWCRSGPNRTPVWIELILVVWLGWVYDMIANLAPLRNALAQQDARSIMDAERWLHLDPEAAMDHWMARHHTLAVWVANYYDNAHFVVTIGALVVIWWKWPDRYRPLRNSLVLLNVIGMAVYWFVPTAPPRLFDPSRFYDVVAATHAFGSWHSGTLATAANELAAMPSLHIAWACWSSMAVWRVLPGRRWAHLVWLYPLATALAVMATGNHFLMDVLAGAADFALSMWIADHVQGWWTTRQARRALEAAPAGAVAEDARA